MCSKIESFGFILKNIEDGGFRYFYAHENNTLLDRSKLVCTKDDLTKIKDIFNKTDVIESCRRERISTQWSFYKLTRLTIFAALLKDISMGCKDAVFSNLCWKITQSTVSRLRRMHDSHIMTTCAFFVLFVFICMEIKN